jgi:hypothetical protein
MHVAAAAGAIDQRIQVRNAGVDKDEVVRKSGTRLTVELWRRLIDMQLHNHAIDLF